MSTAERIATAIVRALAGRGVVLDNAAKASVVRVAYRAGLRPDDE